MDAPAYISESLLKSNLHSFFFFYFYTMSNTKAYSANKNKIQKIE